MVEKYQKNGFVTKPFSTIFYLPKKESRSPDSLKYASVNTYPITVVSYYVSVSISRSQRNLRIKNRLYVHNFFLQVVYQRFSKLSTGFPFLFLKPLKLFHSYPVDVP